MRARIDEFEERLKYTNREMDIFMKKDPPVLTMDEMRSSVKVIDDINERSIKAVDDLRDINQEEVKSYDFFICKSVNWFMHSKLQNLENVDIIWSIAS